jgi:hypothetical protein
MNLYPKRCIGSAPIRRAIMLAAAVTVLATDAGVAEAAVISPDTTIASWSDRDSTNPIDEDGSGDEGTVLTWSAANADTVQWSVDGGAYSTPSSTNPITSIRVTARSTPHTVSLRARRSSDGALDPTPATRSLTMCPRTGCVTATPSPVPTGDPLPASGVKVGPLRFRDEFAGTTLDASRWKAMQGWNINNVTTSAANVAVSGGSLILALSSTSTGAAVSSARSDGAGVNGYQRAVGDYTEARVYFPGSSSQPIFNWPGWWSSGPSWPAAGEHDIAEGLGGTLTVNYHGTTNSKNYGTVPGVWQNAFHTYGLHRKPWSADVYWDGVLVKSYPTGDNGVGQSLIVNVGKSGSRTPVTGSAGALKVDYVRVWSAG